MARTTLIAATLWMACAGGPASAAVENEDLEGLPVREVAFSPPAQPIPPARLGQLLAIRPGSPFRLDEVGQSIHRMFATGRYADIQVDAARAGDGVKVTFITTDNWFIGPVKVLHVKEPPTAEQLIGATGLELGEPYSQQKRETAKEGLRQLLAANGFYAPSIEVETQAHTDTQQIDITFQVEPGPRAVFGQLRLSGGPDMTVEQALRIAGWSAGGRFTRPVVERGLARLRRHYQDRDQLQAVVRAAGQKFDAASNRVDLEVEIRPGPRVQVVVAGAKLSRKQLRRYLPIYAEGAVDRDLLVEGARNLRDHFQTEGYFDAKVDYGQHPEESGQVQVEFQVLLGQRHQFVELAIAGNRYFDQGAMRERLYLRPKSLQFRRGRFSQSLLRSDKLAIEELYRSNGFQNVRVNDRVEDDYRGKMGDLAVFLTVDEGPQTLVSRLTIQGHQAFSTERLSARVSSIEGQPFSELNVASDRSQILSLYFSEGFADATLEWRSQPAAEPHRVAIEYVIREGGRQFVQQVIVNGYERTKEPVIRRQIQLLAGEPLSQGEIIESQRRLYDLGIFSKVDIATQNQAGSETFRNVLLQVEEARKWTMGVGGGAEIGRIGGSRTSLESPAGETGFSPRLALDVSRLNMFGSAGTLSFRSRVSSLQQRGLLTYQVPQWRGRERLTLTYSSLYDTSRNVRTFTASRLEGALQLQHRISRPSTLFYRYSYRRVKVDPATLKIPQEDIPLLSKPVRVGALSASFAQDRRDDPLDAKRGIYNTVDMGVAAGWTGSEANLFRLLAQNSSYHPVSRRVLLARTTQLGGLAIFGDLLRDQVPLPERFFSGGSNSHRGFPINQAGPRDRTTGFPLGGGGLLLNSVELRFPVQGEDISGVLFHDAGNVFRESRPSFRVRQKDPGDFDYMVHAVGGGVRYRTPIGPIRVDLAYSINPPRFLTQGAALDRISRFQFHVSLGQTF